MCFASNVTSATSKNMQPSRETACNPGRAVGLPQLLHRSWGTPVSVFSFYTTRVRALCVEEPQLGWITSGLTIRCRKHCSRRPDYWRGDWRQRDAAHAPSAPASVRLPPVLPPPTLGDTESWSADEVSLLCTARNYNRHNCLDVVIWQLWKQTAFRLRADGWRADSEVPT